MERLLKQALNSPSRKEPLQHLQRIAHRLAGSGGTFGHTEVGELGHVLENRVGEILVAEQEIEPAWQELGRLLSALNTQLRSGGDSRTEGLTRQPNERRTNDIRYQEKSIFVVDDEPYMHRLLRHVTEDLGFGGITEFADGNETIAHVSEHGLPDVMLCDIEMQSMDGFELVTRLADTLRIPTSQVPVVFLTRHSEFDVAHRAKQLGTRAFVLKPPSITTLKNRIDLVLTDRETAA